MKKFGKILCVLLAVTCLAGCGSSSSKEPVAPDTEFQGGRKSNVEETKEEVSVEETTEDVATEETTEEVAEDTQSEDGLSLESDGTSTVNSTTIDGTAYYLTDEAMTALGSLESDYHKIKWGVVYSPDGMDGFVISIAPYMDGDTVRLLIAFTNLYNEEVFVNARGDALDANGNKIGSVSGYELTIGSGNSVLYDIECKGTPTGEIHWETIEVKEAKREYVPWEGDWQLGTDANGNYAVQWNLTGDKSMDLGFVRLIAVDENGYICGCAQGYGGDPATSFSGTEDFYSGMSGTPADIAMFANPFFKE